MPGLRRARPAAAGGAFRGPTGWVEELGLAALALTLCLRHYAGVLLGRTQLDLPALATALRHAGLSILPAMTLIAAALGIILGFQTERLLGALNLPSLLLLSIGHAVVMELIPVLVGILVAGRAGVALALRQAQMIANGQTDGLLVCGIDPIVYTTAPVLLAMLAMSFAFAVWGTLVTFTATLVWLAATADLPVGVFLDALRRALSGTDLAAALAKPMVFALVIALIATVNGTAAGRDADGSARAATRTMIGAVSAILLIDLAFVLWRV